MVNSTVVANAAVVDSVLERLQKERDAELSALEEKKARRANERGVNDAFNAEEIRKVDEKIQAITNAYNQKESMIRDTESRINSILSTASVEKRQLTADEIVEIINYYKTLEKETGESMTKNKKAQDLLGNNLAALTTTTSLNMLEQAGVIGSVTKRNIENLENQKDKVAALHDAIINYNNARVEEKRIGIDDSEKRKISDIQYSIDSLRSKTVTIGIRQELIGGPVALPNALGNHIEAFATGGNIQSHRMDMNNFMGIVGEAGPEVVRFTKRGVHITPLSTREKMRGINGVLNDNATKTDKGSVINVNIYNPVIKEDMNIKDLTDQVGRELITLLNRHNFMMRGGTA